MLWSRRHISVGLIGCLVFFVARVAALDDYGIDARVTAVKRLITRRFGEGVHEQFELQIIAKNEDGMDVLEMGGGSGSKIRLAGSSGTALASAVYWYVKTAVNHQVSWDTKDPDLSGMKLPNLNTKVRMERNTKYTYYQNVCTVSYSMWSWSWEQWERHLDWMALNGINLPLAFTGQEYVWAKVFREHFGISQLGLDAFFSGAAFLAWNRMGNIRGSWGPGVLPTKFILDQHILQKKILKRMKELEMTPVLPGFAGHVPAEMQLKFPHANITLAPNWGRFELENCCVRTLEPTDGLFHSIGQLFIEEQRKLYGELASSIYQMDTYNEMEPRSGALEYLGAAAAAVFAAMRAGDPQGVWLLQGWLFIGGWWSKPRVKAYLGAVPDDAMVVLDLFSEVQPQWKLYEGYFGKPWIYCVLHNFGGNLGIRGDLPKLGTDIVASLQESKGGMVGVGLTMEGIFQNYVVYHLALEMAWRAAPVTDMGAWVRGFARERYGGETGAGAAWALLLGTAYNASSGWGVTKSLVDLRPSLKLARKPGGFMPRVPTYAVGSMAGVVAALLEAAEAAPRLGALDAFRYDVVDATRQLLSDAFLELYRALVADVGAGAPAEAVCEGSLKMRTLLEDLDRVLGTHRCFVLGCWLAEAAALAGGDGELARYYQYQARNQVTRWGPRAEIGDYASKTWAGLVRGYYAERWGIFLEEACAAAREGRAMDVEGTAAAIDRMELSWQMAEGGGKCAAAEDALTVSRAMLERYGSVKDQGGGRIQTAETAELRAIVNGAAAV